MKTYIMVVLLGICLLGLPFTSSAALDWRIKWDETESLHTAKVYIFNPENSLQSFTLEIGDVAQTSDSDPSAPYLIVGQDVSLRNIAPSERKIFDIIVYKDFDPQQALSTTMDARASQLGIEQHRQQMRVLGERYGTSSSREYPVEITKVEPVPRDGATNRLIYQSRRGYWITTLIDHDHIAEQLIRTGDRMGATYSSIQQAIYYYTQGSVQLTGEAAEIWETAFPELKTELTPTPYPYGDCMYFVTMVTSNLSAYSAGRSISVGDILASNNSSLSRVVAAEDLDFTVSPNTPTSKRTLRVYLMSQRGKPTEQSEYVQIINHSSQLEQVIRVGIAERYHACAIQEVIYYINGEISSLTIGKGLWDRLGGGGTGGIQPTPTQPVSGSQSICLGNPTTQPGKMAAMTFKNLIVLVGAVVPFGLFMRRKNPKD